MNRLHPIIGSIASQIKRQTNHKLVKDRHPFVTVSRQPGAGANTLAHTIAARLEQLDKTDPLVAPWTAFDKNLTDKVAQDFHLSKRLIESIEDSSFNWLRELFDNISSTHSSVEANQMKAYSAVAKTMWALAHGGRVILVDRGGVFVTQSLPKGVHVRLVAPWDYRVKNIAKERGLTDKEAREDLEKLEEKRAAFFKQYWSDYTLEAQNFTVTYNTSQLDEDKIANSVVDLVKSLNPK